MDENFCAACKYLVGRRHYSEKANEWRCHAPANVVGLGTDLVTGARTYTLKFETCYEARDNEQGCGPTGKWYEKYNYEAPRVVGGAEHTASRLLEELDNLGGNKG